MDPTKAITSFFMLIVATGVIIMAVRNPKASNTLISAGADSIAGVTTALGGHPGGVGGAEKVNG